MLQLDKCWLEAERVFNCYIKPKYPEYSFNRHSLKVIHYAKDESYYFSYNSNNFIKMNVVYRLHKILKKYYIHSTDIKVGGKSMPILVPVGYNKNSGKNLLDKETKKISDADLEHHDVCDFEEIEENSTFIKVEEILLKPIEKVEEKIEEISIPKTDETAEDLTESKISVKDNKSGGKKKSKIEKRKQKKQNREKKNLDVKN